ncbi:hypothetical protein [Paenibacillus dendritiformis]|uniref:hypothetical protein n=1 Tax=Paenibacillus dendritiformis TaxID=130049 RepID=UPI00387E1AD6
MRFYVKAKDAEMGEIILSVRAKCEEDARDKAIKTYDVDEILAISKNPFYKTYDFVSTTSSKLVGFTTSNRTSKRFLVG